MDITKLGDYWRGEESRLEKMFFSLGGDTCADELEDALPKWTEITDNPDTWPAIQVLVLVASLDKSVNQDVLIFRNQMVRSMFFKDYENYTHWRPLCSIDHPPKDKS